MENIIDIVKNISKQLNETIQSSDIEQTDSIISAVIDQKFIDSLAYQICDIQPIYGPTGGQFSVQYDRTNKKTTVIRTPVAVHDDSIEDTGFTLEAMQDMQRQYGKDIVGFISKAFAGISAFNENTYLLDLLDTASEDQTDLTLSTPSNAQTVLFEISQKIGESIMKMNSKNYRTLDTFVILPSVAAASIISLGTYFSLDADGGNGLYLGRQGRIKYYMNPDPESTTAYVGLHSSTPGLSSLILSPYQHTLITAIDPDSGERKIFMVNRYAMTENSLSVTGNKMLHKFEIKTS